MEKWYKIDFGGHKQLYPTPQKNKEKEPSSEENDLKKIILTVHVDLVEV